MLGAGSARSSTRRYRNAAASRICFVASVSGGLGWLRQLVGAHPDGVVGDVAPRIPAVTDTSQVAGDNP